jgi:hypothetical protein
MDRLNACFGSTSGRYRTAVISWLGRVLLSVALALGFAVAPALAGPAISVNTSSLDFGSRLVGSSASQSVTITAGGDAALLISSVTLAGDSNFVIPPGGDTGASSLAPGATRSITIQFTPSAPGSRNALLTINSNAPGSPTTVLISGSGAGTPGGAPSPILCVADALGVFFPTIALCSTIAKPRGLDVSNCGSAPLTITGIRVIGPAAGDYSISQSCAGVVFNPGAICRINIAFTPTATGRRNAFLEIDTAAPAGTVLVPLYGGGAATGSGSGSSTSTITVNFGNVPVGTISAPQSFTITNTTSQPLTISDASFVGANPGSFSIVGGSVTLAPGETRTIVVIFTPKLPGTQTASLFVPGTSTCGSTLTEVVLIGTGTTTITAGASVSTVPAFCPQLLNTSSAPQTVFLTNTGPGTISIKDVHLEGANPGDFHILSGGTPGPLASGASRPIVVVFTPTAPGTRSAILTVVTDDPASPHQVTLTGVGTTSASLFTPTTLVFGSQPMGTTSAPQSIVFTNPGNTALDITSVFLSQPIAGEFAIVSGQGGGSLPGGGSRTISLTFTPVAAGTRTATLTVTTNGGLCTQTATIIGTGTANPNPAVSVSTIPPFCPQLVGTTSGSQAVIVTNTGSVPVIINGIAFAGTAFENSPFGFGQNISPPLTLPVGASLSIPIVFHPTAAGSHSVPLSISSNAAGSPHLVTVSGVGTASASLFTPTSLVFGSQAQGTTSAPQSITFTNPGSTPLDITSVFLSQPIAGEFAIVSGQGGGSLPGGGSRTISLTFTPATTGTRTATLTIVTNGGVCTQTATISGTGTAIVTASVSVTPPSLFCPQLLGTTSGSQTVIVTNTGSVPAIINSINFAGTAFENSQFGFGQNISPPLTLPVGASVSIPIVFHPSAAGSHSVLLSISSNAAGSPQLVMISGVGTATASLFTPTSLVFGGQVQGTTSAVQTITFTNPGSTPLDISIALDGPNKDEFTIVAGGGAGTIPGGGTRTISLTFRPTGAGQRSAILKVSSNAGGCLQSASISGTGLPVVTECLPTQADLFASAVNGVPTHGDDVRINVGDCVTLTYRVKFRDGDFVDVTNEPTTVFFTDPSRGMFIAHNVWCATAAEANLQFPIYARFFCLPAGQGITDTVHITVKRNDGLN